MHVNTFALEKLRRGRGASLNKRALILCMVAGIAILAFALRSALRYWWIVAIWPLLPSSLSLQLSTRVDAENDRVCAEAILRNRGERTYVTVRPRFDGVDLALEIEDADGGSLAPMFSGPVVKEVHKADDLINLAPKEAYSTGWHDISGGRYAFSFPRSGIYRARATYAIYPETYEQYFPPVAEWPQYLRHRRWVGIVRTRWHSITIPSDFHERQAKDDGVRSSSSCVGQRAEKVLRNPHGTRVSEDFAEVRR